MISPPAQPNLTHTTTTLPNNNHLTLSHTNMATPDFSNTPYDSTLHGPLLNLSPEDKRKIASLRCASEDNLPNDETLDIFITQDNILMHQLHAITPAPNGVTWNVTRKETNEPASNAFISHLRVVLGFPAGHTQNHAREIANHIYNQYNEVHPNFSLATLIPNSRPLAPAPTENLTTTATPPPALNPALVPQQPLFHLPGLPMNTPLLNSPADASTAHQEFTQTEKIFSPGDFPPQADLDRISNQSWIRQHLNSQLPNFSSWYRGDPKPLRHIIFGSLHYALSREELLFAKRDESDWLKILRNQPPANEQAKPQYRVCKLVWNLITVVRPRYELPLLCEARALYDAIVDLQPPGTSRTRFLSEVLEEMYSHSSTVGNSLFVHLNWAWLIQRLKAQLHFLRQTSMALHGTADSSALKRPPPQGAAQPVPKRLNIPAALRAQIVAKNLCIRFHQGIPHQCPPGRTCGVYIWNLNNSIDSQPMAPPATAPTANPSLTATQAPATRKK